MQLQTAVDLARDGRRGELAVIELSGLAYTAKFDLLIKACSHVRTV